jgi:hypothetical protein
MGGTTHAASAAPARMPSENTAMATAIRTAQLNVLNLSSSSAVTEFSAAPGGSKQYNCGPGTEPPTFLRLRSPPFQPACWCDSFEFVDARAKPGHRTCAPLLGSHGLDTARI